MYWLAQLALRTRSRFSPWPFAMEPGKTRFSCRSAQELLIYSRARYEKRKWCLAFGCIFQPVSRRQWPREAIVVRSRSVFYKDRACEGFRSLCAQRSAQSSALRRTLIFNAEVAEYACKYHIAICDHHWLAREEISARIPGFSAQTVNTS